MTEITEDEDLIRLVEERLGDMDGLLISMEEMMEEFGITQEAIDRMPDVEFE